MENTTDQNFYLGGLGGGGGEGNSILTDGGSGAVGGSTVALINVLS